MSDRPRCPSCEQSVEPVVGLVVCPLCEAAFESVAVVSYRTIPLTRLPEAMRDELVNANPDPLLLWWGGGIPGGWVSVSPAKAAREFLGYYAGEFGSPALMRIGTCPA